MKVYLNEITFRIVFFIQGANAFCMSCLWFAFSTKTPAGISNSTALFFRSDYSFPRHLFFRDSFKTPGLYMHGWYYSDNYSSSEVSLYSFPLFPSSEVLFINSSFGMFLMKLVLSSKFVLSFWSLLDI